MTATLPSGAKTPRRARAKARHTHGRRKPAARAAKAKARRFRNPPESIRRQRLWRRDCPLLIWREVRNLTRADAAAALHVSTSSVMQWEQGGKVPSDENLARISKLIGKPAGHWRAWQKRKPK